MDYRIGYVTVIVSDLDRAVAFYRDIMGFELLFAEPEFHYAGFRLGDIRFSIAVSPDENYAYRNTGIGFFVADVDATHADLAARGVHFTMPPGKQPWGGYMAMFTDPDGNGFYLDSAG